MYKNKPHMIEELKQNIRRKIISISVNELQRMNAIFLIRCQECIICGSRTLYAVHVIELQITLHCNILHPDPTESHTHTYICESLCCKVY